MKFWKFEAPSGEEIGSVVSGGGLPLSVVVPSLRNTYEEVARKLKPGDGVVLASLQGEEGKISAFGKVRAAGGVPEEVSIQWAQASHAVYPTGSGMEHWSTKTAFEISADPAKRYGLRRFIDFHIKDSE